MRASRLNGLGRSSRLREPGSSRKLRESSFIASVRAVFRRGDVDDGPHSLGLSLPDAFDSSTHSDDIPPHSSSHLPKPKPRPTMRDLQRSGSSGWTGLLSRKGDPALSMGTSFYTRRTRSVRPLSSPRSSTASGDAAASVGAGLPVFAGWVRHYSSYGTNHGIDLFSLLHNAARREFVDMYCILSSIARREKYLDADDLREFFLWFRVFEDFLVAMFKHEEDVVIQWILTLGGDYPQELEASERQHLRGEIYETLNTIGDLRGLLLRESLGDLISALVEASDTLAEKTLSWFDLLEQNLVAIVAERCTPDSKTRIELELVDGFLKGEHPHHSIPMLTRWMEDPELIDFWIINFVHSKQARRAMPAWNRTFRERHVAYAEHMYENLVKYQKIYSGSRTNLSGMTPPTT